MKQPALYAVGPVVLAGVAWWLAAPGSPELTTPLTDDGMLAQPEDARVTAFHFVNLNAEALMGAAPAGGVLALTLANGEVLQLDLESAEATVTGGRVMRGQVAGQGDSAVLLTEEEGLWAGSIDMSDGRFLNLLHAGRGRYRLEQVDLAAEPICDGDETPALWSDDGSAVTAEDRAHMVQRPLAGVTNAPPRTRTPSGSYLRINLRLHPRTLIRNPRRIVDLWPKRPTNTVRPTSTTNGNATSTPQPGRPVTMGPANPSRPSGSGTGNRPTPVRPATAGSSGGSVIDLLVVYCTGAERQYGGVTGIKSAAQLAVQQANDAFSRSGASVRLTLQHVAPVNYSSAGNLSSDLHNVSFKDKALHAEVDRLRTRYNADLVTLVSNRGGGGVGWLLMKRKGSARFGFNVVGNGALRGYTLAHEVGHNLGCQHAKGDRGAGHRGLFAYGYGHRFNARNANGASRQYRTVMAYAPGRRIGRFSSPGARYLGSPTGTSDANNVSVLNQTVRAVSAYR